MAPAKSADNTFQKLLKANETFLASGSFKSPGPMSVVPTMVKEHGFKGVYILTCADSRIMPEEIFGLKKGQANVLRNAGGRAIESDVFRSLGLMSTIVPIGILVVLHHTDCGGLFTTNEEVAGRLAERAPQHAHEVNGKVFGTFRDIGLEQSIRDDVDKINSWPFLEKDAKVLGYAYEVETGRLRHICGPVPQTNKL